MGVDILDDATWFAILSTETKPTNVVNDTVCIEVDTQKVFIFYKGTWYEQ